MTGDRPIGDDDLQAFIDGRLAPERRETVDAYLALNPATAARITADRTHRDALRARLAFKAAEPIPARLRVAHLRAGRRQVSMGHLAAAAVACAWLAGGGALGWFAHAALRGARIAGGEGAVAADAIAAYRTYVVETAHPVEVGANQEGHLVQWLSKRLGKPLSAPNLTAEGFRLIGGRLLPAGAAPAALFMYEDDRGTRVTLYMRPGAAENPTAFRFEAAGDVAAFSWLDQGLSYVIAARTDRDRLLRIAETVHRQLEQRPPSKDRL